MRTDNHRVGKMIFGIFLGFGVLFFVLGIILAIALKQGSIDNYVEIPATIDEIVRYNDSHSVYINYELDGDEYRHIKYNVYHSGWHEGSDISVMVDKYNPTRFYIGNFSLIFGGAFGGFGLIFGLVGIIPLIAIHKKEAYERKLRETGHVVWGIINGVKINYSVSVNNRHPYKINIKYEDESIVTTSRDFQSGNVWIDGDPHEYIGKSVRVFVDANDTSKYLVDIDSVME